MTSGLFDRRGFDRDSARRASSRDGGWGERDRRGAIAISAGFSDGSRATRGSAPGDRGAGMAHEGFAKWPYGERLQLASARTSFHGTRVVRASSLHGPPLFTAFAKWGSASRQTQANERCAAASRVVHALSGYTWGRRDCVDGSVGRQRSARSDAVRAMANERCGFRCADFRGVKTLEPQISRAMSGRLRRPDWPAVLAESSRSAVRFHP